MSTRGVIARLTGTLPPQFRGVYHHWDSYPSGLGHALWHLYHGQFNRDLGALLRVLVDEHPAGWSTVVGRDFDLLPGFTEFGQSQDAPADEHEGDRPLCYCHGDQHEAGWPLTEENAACLGCEWAYAFSDGSVPDHDFMLVLSSYRPSGQKMVGFFGQGDAQAVWTSPVIGGTLSWGWWAR